MHTHAYTKQHRINEEKYFKKLKVGHHIYSKFKATPDTRCKKFLVEKTLYYFKSIVNTPQSINSLRRSYTVLCVVT